jgi:hypothetical protein
MMKAIYYAGACLAVAGVIWGASATSANAAPAYTPIPQAEQNGSVLLLKKVHGCHYWYRECRERWGYGWRFRRCLRHHGC